MSAEAAFQDAVLARLRGEAAVKAVLGDRARVHAQAPPGAAFPFLTFGRAQSEPVDGRDAALLNHRRTLLVHGRADDAEDVGACVSAVRGALHDAGLELRAPWRCVFLQVVFVDLVRARDRRGWTGLIRLKALIARTEEN